MVNSLLILFVHNRPNVLKACLGTLFHNAGIEFEKVLIINDGSRKDVTDAVFNLVARHPEFDLIHFGKNIKYGNAARVAFDRIERINPKYVFWMEQDYVWRKNWAAEAVAVLEANPDTIGVPGYSHPDYYNPDVTGRVYPEVIVKEFGEDISNRDLLFKPFVTETSLGPILVQGVSNACGTSIWNWQNIKRLRDLFRFEVQHKIIDETCAPGGHDQYFGDGTFTHGTTLYHSKQHDGKGFAWLDICDFSLGNHLSGGEDSINGFIVPEMVSHVPSPKWKDKYINHSPRCELPT